MERAMIDEKNVSTDWMESVFDDYPVQDRNTMVGFIHHCPVIAHWNSNVIVWEVMPIGWEDHTYAFLLLEQRLKEWENEEQNVYSTIQHGELGKFQIIQSFYFKED